MEVKLYLGEALGLIVKTLPFIWIRLGTYALLGIGLGLYFAVAGGVAWLLGQVLAPLGIIVFLIAWGGAWALVQWASRYFFYLLRAAHTAVMTEHIVYGRGPAGSQVAYGKQQVMDRFRDTSIMFAVDQVIDGVVRNINRTFARLTRILPIPGQKNLNKIVSQVTKFATTYIDEAILSRAYQYREQNVWAVAQDGVILYAQAWKPVLANAAALTVISFLEMALVLVILGIPAIAVGALFPLLRVPLGVLVLLGVWMFKLAVSDAYALAATLLAYHRATAGVAPNPEWQARLEQGSDKFRQLRDRATEAMAQSRSQPRDSAPNRQPADLDSGDLDSGDLEPGL
jgi:hypothetical protein